MNTVKSEEVVKSSSSEELAAGKCSGIIIVDISDVLRLFQLADERLQDSVLFEDVINQALERRFDQTPGEFDVWLWTMRYLLEDQLSGDDLEEGIARLEMLIDIMADKLSTLRLYQAGKLRYRYLLRSDRLYLMQPATYKAIVLSEVMDAPF